MRQEANTRSRTLRWSTTVAAFALMSSLAACTAEEQQQIGEELEDAIEDVQRSLEDEPAATEPEPANETPATSEDTTSEPSEASVTEPTTTTSPDPEPLPDDEEESALGEFSDRVIDLLPWLLGLLAVAMALLAVVVASRRRTDARARRDRLRDATLSDADWLLGVARERAAVADAAARIRDIRMRFDRLTDALDLLRREGRHNMTAAADDLQLSARHLVDALIARLDDAATRGELSTGFDLEALALRMREARDAFSSVLGRRPERT